MPAITLDHCAARDFFGTTLTPFPESELPAMIERCRAAKSGAAIIGHHNLHSLYRRHKEAPVARFYEACDYCYVDGVPVLWLLRALGIREPAARFSLMDCLPSLLGKAEQRGWRLCYLGSTPAVVERARAWAARQWPALQLTLVDGYREDGDAFAAVEDARPDVLLVGMGMPKQEAWIMAHAQRLPHCVILQAGGTLDYYTGAQARPPALLSRLGLAGLYRLLRNPRRLWRRYLLEPWSLVAPILEFRRRLCRSGAE
ncbi:WecB/TagA/CpsF family glycosyltransferase [Pseudohaliea sp.]|uniref:WecB/TagA/CpsF family glycosyltransferase n=1 Tax=Pseudohaliea sp. TaxID=2740289 RepID=UPI0032EC14C7